MGGSRRWWRELPKSCCCLAVQNIPHCLGCSDKSAAESLGFDNFAAGSSCNLDLAAGCFGNLGSAADNSVADSLGSAENLFVLQLNLGRFCENRCVRFCRMP